MALAAKWAKAGARLTAFGALDADRSGALSWDEFRSAGSPWVPPVHHMRAAAKRTGQVRGCAPARPLPLWAAADGGGASAAGARASWNAYSTQAPPGAARSQATYPPRKAVSPQ